MIVPKDTKQASVKPPSYHSGSGSFDNRDSKLKVPNVPEQSQRPVTSTGSSSQRLRCTQCSSHKVAYDSAPIKPRNIHGRRFTYAGAYFALFIVLFAIAEVVTETLGGKFAASGVLQIIVALISAGTGVTLVNLLRLGRRTQPTKARFYVLCGLGSGWFCLTGGVVSMDVEFYANFPEPFPSCPLFTVVSILSGGLLTTLIGAACAEYRGFRRVNKSTIASFPGNLGHATMTDQPYPLKRMSTNDSV
ncbi:hypothetical protein B0H13DRAFT_2069601 [Mycena leptocephala]|nr:hypothetical protein B0H13DRAFT_2069601 [Mycena leptocephala]